MFEYLFLIVGIFLLLKGANYLVDGASIFAQKIKVSALIIGLTIVAFGTSMPELIVNIFATLKNSNGIILGNIIGSNLANILLVFGICAIIYQIKLKKTTIWKELPFSVLAVVLLLIFTNYFIIDSIVQNKILRIHGLIMLLFFIIFLYYVFEIAKKDRESFKEITNNIDKKIVEFSNTKTFFLIIIGIISLYFGGKLTVQGAIIISQNLGISEFLISATIIAIGTSLPELITAIVAIMKKKVNLAVGNIIGSNIFNILWVLGITSIIKPIAFPEFIFIDLMALLIASFVLFTFMFIGNKHSIDKWQGVLLILIYILYVSYIIYRG
ncbi:MAG: calcium/sodium antiporter [Nanoarchaeota archaeon]